MLRQLDLENQRLIIEIEPTGILILILSEIEKA